MNWLDTVFAQWNKSSRLLLLLWLMGEHDQAHDLFTIVSSGDKWQLYVMVHVTKINRFAPFLHYTDKIAWANIELVR